MATWKCQTLRSLSAPFLWASQHEGKGDDVHSKERDTQVACPARWVLRTEVLWSL